MANQDVYFLRENIFVDPLINNWYAWSNLVSPITYSMYMSKTHRRLLNSFINNHELHIIARKDSSLANLGEFVGCDTDELDEVKALVEKLETEHSLYLDLANAVKELNMLVKEHKTGESIEPLYAKIPDMLKGYIELFMDIYHQPSYRIIEGLIYKSHYYNTSLQSVNLGILTNSKDRPSTISTPRFITNETINVKTPFESPFWDRLFRTREHPITQSQIRDLFDGQEVKGGLSPFSLFTKTKPSSSYRNTYNSEVRVQYVGHAGLLVQTMHTTILMDPVIPYRTDDISDKVISFCDLPEHIDYICLTHNHSDHICIETLLQLRYKTGTILVPKNNGGSLADPSLKLLLTNIGFKVHEMEDLEEIGLKDGRLLSIPFLGEHGDLNIRSKTAWFLELNGKKIYAGADSSNLDSNMFEHIHKITGDIDILAVGMECVGAPFTWIYGAFITEPVNKEISKSRRLNGADFDKAMRMVNILKPGQVLIYALGLEPWYQYLMGVSFTKDAQQIKESDKLIKYCQDLNIPAKRLEGHYSHEMSTSC